MANVFIVAPESLSTLFEGTPSIRKDAQRYHQCFLFFLMNSLTSLQVLSLIQWMHYLPHLELGFNLKLVGLATQSLTILFFVKQRIFSNICTIWIA